MAGIPVLIFANKQDLLSSKPAEVSCALFKNKFFLLYFPNVTPSTRLFSLTHSLTLFLDLFISISLEQEVAEELNDTLDGRDFHVQAASAKKDEGLSEGLEWLVQTMNQSKKATK